MNIAQKLRDLPVIYWLIILIAATFSPVLMHTFGRLDDMAFAHWFARDFHATMRDIFVAQGRPLHGLLLAILLNPVATFGDLVWLRLLSILLVCVFALQIFQFLQSRGLAPKQAAPIAFLLVANPGIAAIVGWAICSTHILGYIIAFATGQWLLSKSSAATWKTLLRDGSMALVALYMVLCLYQPAAAFILLPVLFNWLMHGRTETDRIGLWWVATLYLLALGSYYIGLKILVDIVLQLNTQAERSALISDLSGKIVFLVNEPLKLLTLSWAFFAGSTLRTAVTLLVSLILLVGIVNLVVREHLKGAVDLIHILAVLCLGLVALIALEANYAPFRTLVFGYLLITFLVCWLGLQTLHRMQTPVLWSLAVLVALSGHYYIRIGIAQPFEREYLHYRQAFIEQHSHQLPASVLWSIPDHFDLRGHVALNRIRFEFGTLSSGMEYVVPGMTWMLLNELHQINSRQHPLWQKSLAVETVPLRHDRQWQRIPNLPFIDGPAIFRGASVVPPSEHQAPWEHPVLGTVETLYNGWMFSDWFGIFNQWVYPGVQHAVLGRVTLERLEGGYFRINTLQHGTLITTPDTFPQAILPSPTGP